MYYTEKSSKLGHWNVEAGAVSKIVLSKHRPFNKAKVYYNSNLHHTYEINKYCYFYINSRTILVYLSILVFLFISFYVQMNLTCFTHWRHLYDMGTEVFIKLNSCRKSI